MKRLLLGFDAREKPIYLDPEDARTHSHVSGASGSGKSKMLEIVMRQHLQDRTGYCLIDPHGQLYEDVLAFAAHRMLDREMILLNVSRPDASIITFNPFRRAPTGDISVQVDRRVTATVHAWGVSDTDQTPTLARTLRLIYTVMLEQNLGLPEIQHLIDFHAREVRSHLIGQLHSELVQREWRELQALKAKEWRDETLSAKNRLFKFLTSDTLCRFMGLPGRSLDLKQVMDEGKVLLVNLAPSDYLSHENARAFGALLVNEFVENALRRDRDELGRPPRAYHLILDEFQSFLSVDVADMLDQVRKFGLFLTLAHQRFGQLDPNIIDAVLTNCRIKAVFGGLPYETAKLMAQELFIRELDPKKIKVAIYQTKFWPQYRRDKVYTKSSSHGSSSSHTESRSSGSSSGISSGMSYDASYFLPDQWFAVTNGFTRSKVSSAVTSSTSGYSASQSDSWADSQGEADIPIFFPVPFQELSSLQYYSLEEQLTELVAALKEQFPRHCFIKIHGQQTQPLLVPFVQGIHSFRTSTENLDWYREWQLQRHHALPAAEIDRLIKDRQTALLQEAAASAGISLATGLAASKAAVPLADSLPSLPETTTGPSPATAKQLPLWNRSETGSEQPVEAPLPPAAPPGQRKRGPKPDLENHAKVADIVRGFGDNWAADDKLVEICEKLDQQNVPIPKRWPERSDGRSRSWRRAYENYPHLVVKAIKDRLKAAQA